MNKSKGGRPSSWISNSKTRLVRIPEYMADEILEIARIKDRGEKISFVQNSDDKLNKITKIIEEFRDNSRDTRDWTKVKQLIKRIDEV